VYRTRVQSWGRAIGGLVGVGVLAAGAITLFTWDSSAGSLFLVAVGFVLLLLAIVGTRAQLESFEILGTKISVRDVIQSRLDMGGLRTAAFGVDPSPPEAQVQAQTLQELFTAYGLYQHIRATQPASDRRTRLLDELAARMRGIGQGVAFDPADVSRWFHDGDDALRIVALNIMLARDDSRDLLAVLKAIEKPRSLFEQYYGLRLASTMAPKLGGLERSLLIDSVGRARGRRRFRRDQHLMAISNSLLQQLQGHR
jgi:hypothetical protein